MFVLTVAVFSQNNNFSTIIPILGICSSFWDNAFANKNYERNSRFKVFLPAVKAYNEVNLIKLK